MKKRLLMVMTAVMLCVTSLAGCGSMKADDVIVTVDDSEMTAAVANFYARYTQAQYEAYFGAYMGNNMWDTKAEEGKTYQDSVKDSVLEQLEKMLLLEQHMGDYQVSLSDAEKEVIAKAVKEFDEENLLESKEKLMADTGTVERVLTLMAIEQKMADAIKKDADTNVSDEEANQKKMDYVFFAYAQEEGSESGKESSEEPTEERKAEVKAAAEEFAKTAGEDSMKFSEIAEAQELEVKSAAFDAESQSPSADLIKAADSLEKNQVTGAVEAEDGYYVAKVTSLNDKDATESKKQQIILERENEWYAEVTDKWLDEAKIKVDKKAWAKIDFNELGITMKQTEQDPYSDEVKTDDQAEGTAGEEE